jgi:proteasome lid subunit RPN8/RPN11
VKFKEKAKEHALRYMPRESCGVVANGEYWPCRNIADEPERDFILEPKDYVAARTYGKIEAIVHSYPKGTPPSEADKKACKTTKIPWYIYSVPEDKWLIINP